MLSLAGVKPGSAAASVFDLVASLAPAGNRYELARAFHDELKLSAEECDDVIQHLLDLDILVDHARGGIDVEPLLRDWMSSDGGGSTPEAV